MSAPNLTREKTHVVRIALDPAPGTLPVAGYLDRDDALIVSNVCAEDQRADEVSEFKLSRIRVLIG